MTRLLFTLALLISFALTAQAVQPDEVLENPALESRARDLSAELRCLVCQNQSIDDSDAPLARDLRVLIRERLTAGDSDEDVMSFVVDRYGEFVLLRPRFGGHTLLLWLGPFVLLGLGILFLMMRRGTRSSAPALEQPLSEEERRKFDQLSRKGE